jgi:hypothetical protein
VFVPDETQSVELALFARIDCLSHPTGALVSDPRAKSKPIVGLKVLRNIEVTMFFDVLKKTAIGIRPSLIDRPFLTSSVHFELLTDRSVGS